MANDSIGVVAEFEGDDAARGLEAFEGRAELAGETIAQALISAGEVGGKGLERVEIAGEEAAKALEEVADAANRAEHQIEDIQAENLRKAAKSAQDLADQMRRAETELEATARLSDKAADALRRIEAIKSGKLPLDPKQLEELAKEIAETADEADRLGKADVSKGLRSGLAEVERASKELKDELDKVDAAFEAIDNALKKGEEGISLKAVGKAAKDSAVGIEDLREKIAKLQAQGVPVPPGSEAALAKLEARQAAVIERGGKLARVADDVGDAFLGAQEKQGFYEGGATDILGVIDRQIPGFANLAAKLALVTGAYAASYQGALKAVQVANALIAEFTGQEKAVDKAIAQFYEYTGITNGIVAGLRGETVWLEKVTEDSDFAANATNILKNTVKDAAGNVVILAADMENLSNRLRQQKLILGAQAESFRALSEALKGTQAGAVTQDIDRLNKALEAIGRSGRPLSEAGKALPGLADEIFKLTKAARDLGEQVPPSFQAAVNGVTGAAHRLKSGAGSVEDLEQSFKQLEGSVKGSGDAIEGALRARLPAIQAEIAKLKKGDGSISDLNRSLLDTRDALLAVEGPLKSGTLQGLKDVGKQVGVARREFAELGVTAPRDIQNLVDSVKAYREAANKNLTPQQAELVAIKIKEIRDAYALLPPASQAALKPILSDLFTLEYQAGKAGAEIRDSLGRLTSASIQGQAAELKKTVAAYQDFGRVGADEAGKVAAKATELLKALEALDPSAKLGLSGVVSSLRAIRDEAARAGVEVRDNFGRLIPASIDGAITGFNQLVKAVGGGAGATAEGARQIVGRAEAIAKAIDALDPISRKSYAAQRAQLEQTIDVYGKLAAKVGQTKDEVIAAADAQAAKLKEQAASVKQAWKDTIATIDEGRRALLDTVKAKDAAGAPGGGSGPSPAEVAALKEKNTLTAEEINQVNDLGLSYSRLDEERQAAAKHAAEQAQTSAAQIAQVDALAQSLKQTTAAYSAIPEQQAALDAVTNRTLEGLKATAAQGQLTADDINNSLNFLQSAYNGTGAGLEAVNQQLAIGAGNAKGIGDGFKQAGEKLPDYVQKLEEQSKRAAQAAEDLKNPATSLVETAKAVEAGAQSIRALAEGLGDVGAGTQKQIELTVSATDGLLKSAENLGKSVPATGEALDKLGDSFGPLGEKAGKAQEPLKAVDTLAGSLADKAPEIEKAAEAIKGIVDGIGKLIELGKGGGIDKVFTDLKKGLADLRSELDLTGEHADTLADKARAAAAAIASIPDGGGDGGDGGGDGGD